MLCEADRDGIEEITDGFAAMDITEHSLVLYVVPKVHNVYWAEEAEEEKKEGNPEAKPRPKLEEFVIGDRK